jgi:heme exporter protein C
MWTWIHKLSSPHYFYDMSAKLVPWFTVPALAIGIYGLCLGLLVAPTDYQQGESYRIIYIHLPAAWISLFVYVVMATSAAIGLIWQIRLADVVAAANGAGVRAVLRGHGAGQGQKRGIVPGP